jgi:hypothetical protein
VFIPGTLRVPNRGAPSLPTARVTVKEARMSTKEKTVVVDGDEARETTKGRWTWSPAQFVAGGIGLLLVVMGGVALARLLPTASLTAESANALGIDHTPLMAIIAIGLGLLFMTQVASVFGAQAGMITLGVVTLAFGLVVVVEPTAFDQPLALGEGGGWFYVAVGVVSIVTGLVSPSVSRTSIRRRSR